MKTGTNDITLSNGLDGPQLQGSMTSSQGVPSPLLSCTSCGGLSEEISGRPWWSALKFQGTDTLRVPGPTQKQPHFEGHPSATAHDHHGLEAFDVSLKGSGMLHRDVHIHIQAFSYMYTNINMYIHMCTHTYVHVDTYICIHICMYTCVRYVYTYIPIYLYA